MKSQLFALLLPTLALAANAFAEESHLQGHAPGIESPDYKWNEMRGEKMKALKLKGNREAGKKTYQICVTCHMPSGVGRADGKFPQLAGQYAEVVIKQLADVRGAVRDNAVMYTHVVKIKTPQQLADVAAFIEKMPIHKKGVARGPHTSISLAQGRALYARDCEECHGPKGEGSRVDFNPIISNQHYPYLVRQLQGMKDGSRRNSNPRMVKAIKPYSNEEIAAVADYISSL